jgi:hypothetical protein
MQENVSFLKVYEWMAVAVIIGIITGLACLTSFYGKGESGRPNLSRLEKLGFDVIIKGAVAQPGVYHIQSEMKMSDLLVLAEVLEKADLRRFKLDGIVKKTRIINVPERALITVHLQGACKNTTSIELLKGSKVEDLLELVDFSDEADLTVLKKKRQLKNDEVIYIPLKSCRQKLTREQKT